MGTRACEQGMHRKRPRKAPEVPHEKKEITWVRRLPPPPVSGFKRRVAVVGIYGITVVIVSLISVLVMWLAAWIMRGVPILSGPGLFVFVPAVAIAVSFVLYVVNKLEVWRSLSPKHESGLY